MAEKKIGARIELSGEKEFRSAITDCNRSLSTMKSELNLVKAQTEGNANSLESLTRVHDVLSRTLEERVRKEDTVRAALANAQENYDKTGVQLDKYKEQLQAARQKLDEMTASGEYSEEELKKQKEEVERLEGEVSKSEAAYSRAGAKVEDWQKQLNNAQVETINASKAVDENAKYMKEAEESADKCATSIDRFGKSVDTATGESKEFTETLVDFKALEQTKEVLNKVSDSVSKLAKSSYSAAKELDRGYDTIVEKTGATGEALQSMYGIADNIFSSMAFDMEQVGIAVGEVNTRFGYVGDTLETASVQFLEFAKINGTDLNSSIDTVDKILTQFGMDAEQAGNVLGILTARGQETGISVTNLMNAISLNSSTLKELGLDVAESANLLAMFEANGIDASTALRGLKTAVANYTKEGMTAREGLEATVESIKNAETSTEALAIAQETFGTRGAQVMADGIRSGRINLDNLSESIDKYGDLVETTYEQTLSPWDSMTVATNALKDAGANLTGEFFTVAKPAVEALTNVVKGATKWFSGLPSPVKSVVAAVGGLTVAVGAVGPKLMGLVSTFKQLKAASDASKAIDMLSKAQNGAAGASNAINTANATAIASTKARAAASNEAAAATGAETTAALANAGAVNTLALSEGAGAAAAEGEAAAEGTLAAAQGAAAASAALEAETTGTLAAAAGADTVAKGAETVATDAATVSQVALNVAMDSCPIMWIVAGVGALVGALVLFASTAEDSVSETQQLARETRSLNDELKESQENLKATNEASEENVKNTLAQCEVAKTAAIELEKLAEKTSLTADEEDRMRVLVGQLNSIYPNLGLQFDSVTKKLNKTSKEIDDYINSMEKMALAEAYMKAAADSYDALVDASEKLVRARMKQKEVDEAHQAKQEQIRDLDEAHADTLEKISELEEKRDKALADGAKDVSEYVLALAELENKTYEVNGEMMTYEEALETLNQEERLLSTTLDDCNNAIDDQEKAVSAAADEAGVYAKAAEEAGVAVDGMSDAEKKAAESTGDLTDAQKAGAETATAALDAYNNLTDSQKRMAEQITVSVLTMQENVKSSLSSQMKLFEEFNAGTEVSKDELLKNMQSQIDGVTAWEQNMATLMEGTWNATEDCKVKINEGLMQYLASMGPEGAPYVEAFVNMTGEELAQANKLWSESVDIQNMTNGWGEALTQGIGELSAGNKEAWERFADEVGDSAITTGGYVVQGLVNGMTAAAQDAANAGEEVADGTLDAVNKALGVASPSTKTKQSGGFVVQGLVLGMNSSKATATAAAKTLGSDVAKTIEKALPQSSFRQVGVTMVSSLATGINSSKNLAVSAAGTMATDTANAAKSTLTAANLKAAGSVAAADFAAGIKSKAQEAVNAGKDLADKATAGVKNNFTSSSMKIHGASAAGYLGTGISSAQTSASMAGANLGITAANAVKNNLTVSDMKSHGYNAAKGLADGITNGKSLVINAARDVANSAAKAAKDALQIKSPSKVFERIGGYTVEGAIEGAENKRPKLEAEYSELGELAIKAYGNAISLADYKSSLADVYGAYSAQRAYSSVSAYGAYSGADADKLLRAIEKLGEDLKSARNFNQTINVVGTKSTAAENARTLRRVGRELAFG